MTKYAIISDIHGNLQALNLVINDSEKRNVDKIICLGDLVNKYFYPKEVVDEVKSISDIVIKGNHEQNVTTNYNFSFARSQLGINRLEYLENLPLKQQIVINKVLINLYHATPNSITSMFNPVYSINKKYPGGEIKDPKEMFIGDEPQTILNGHTHIQYMGKMSKDGNLILEENDYSIITNKDNAIINAGSVGEVNVIDNHDDGKYNSYIQNYVSYVIINDDIEEEKLRVEIIKVPYKETLKSIYFDRINMIEKGVAPKAPKDNEQIYNSLLKMGYTSDELTQKKK